MRLQWIAIHPVPPFHFLLKGKNSRIRAGEGESNGRLWESCWRAPCIFRAARLSPVADSNNNQDSFFKPLGIIKSGWTIGETFSPRVLKHCGAIKGALNIPAQHDAARRSLDCAPLLCGPFQFVPLISLKSTQVQFHRKTMGTKWLLEPSRASSKTQYGGLRWQWRWWQREWVEGRGLIDERLKSAF